MLLRECLLVSSMNYLEEYDQAAVDEIEVNEERLDAITDKVDVYLLYLAPHTPKGVLYDKLNYYTQCLSVLERIGDHAKNIADEASELYNSGVEFSSIAKQEMNVLCDAVKENISYACAAVEKLDLDAARRIEPLEEVIDDLVAQLRQKHIQRLHASICTTQSGICFLEVLSNLERISDQCSNIGLFTLSLKAPEVMNSLHDYASYLHSGKDTSLNETYAICHKTYFDHLNAE